MDNEHDEFVQNIEQQQHDESNVKMPNNSSNMMVHQCHLNRGVPQLMAPRWKRTNKIPHQMDYVAGALKENEL